MSLANLRIKFSVFSRRTSAKRIHPSILTLAEWNEKPNQIRDCQRERWKMKKEVNKMKTSNINLLDFSRYLVALTFRRVIVPSAGLLYCIKLEEINLLQQSNFMLTLNNEKLFERKTKQR